jgi:cystine transport system substrate-binding protein
VFGQLPQQKVAEAQPETCVFLHEERLSSPKTVVRSRTVLAQAQTPRRRLLPFAAFALAVLVAPAVSGAIPSHSVSSLRARDAAIVAKSRAAVLGLYSLDRQLASANARIAALNRRTMSLQAQRAELDRELHIARTGTRLAERRLGQRIRQLYEQGTVEPLEIVFGAKSLDEAMTSLDSLNRASAQSESVLRELKTAKKRLSTASRSLASKQAALEAATREAAATAASLADARSRRAAYVASLASAHRLTKRQIAAVVARAQQAAARTAAIVHVPAVPGAPYIGTPAAGRTLTVSATGYSMPGHTASGLPVGWGVVAVDPSVIPLGTHMTVPGYGSAVAADTGSGVSGATIDLWFPTIAQANAWGRRTVTIVLH